MRTEFGMFIKIEIRITLWTPKMHDTNCKMLSYSILSVFFSNATNVVDTYNVHTIQHKKSNWRMIFTALDIIVKEFG